MQSFTKVFIACLLSACAQVPPAHLPLREVTGREAVSVLEKEKIQVLDVRSKNEAQNGQVPDAIRVRYGPERGSRNIQRSPAYDREFLSQVRRLLPDPTLPLLVFCNEGVRSLPAGEALSEAGYSVILVRDGYMGNGQGEGMAFYLPAF